jgi:hypothetical protein
MCELFSGESVGPLGDRHVLELSTPIPAMRVEPICTALDLLVSEDDGSTRSLGVGLRKPFDEDEVVRRARLRVVLDESARERRADGFGARRHRSISEGDPLDHG